MDDKWKSEECTKIFQFDHGKDVQKKDTSTALRNSDDRKHDNGNKRAGVVKGNSR